MNKKIVCKIKGGFANQCIQFVFAKTMAKKTNRELYLDLSDYKFGGVIQKIKGNTKQELFDYLSEQPAFNFSFFLEAFNCFGFVFSDGDPISDIINCDSSLIYLNGYWHQDEYIDELDFSIIFELEREISKRISPSCMSLLEKIKSFSDSVSIHVRRGDYLEGKHKEIYGVCSIDYFIKSFEFICSKIDSMPEVFIFTDDPGWIDDKFNAICRYHLVSGPTSLIDDFVLMMSCKHNIISNSSFSWLSAMLNTQGLSIKIAPKAWFKSTKMRGLSTRYFHTIETELE
ncbi:alpha-1,2-fucosyltransferase [Vibrio cholerae]|nr:alpha-1,2-fucosyltransferase [Vibrio cholerae]